MPRASVTSIATASIGVLTFVCALDVAVFAAPFAEVVAFHSLDGADADTHATARSEWQAARGTQAVNAAVCS